ncbi:MAG: hypothetical protein WDM80_19055 [Limisphaerales bacterium]
MKPDLAIPTEPEPARSELISVSPARRRSPFPRILFQNEFVSLVLVRLLPGQRLHFARPVLRLLTVNRGHVRMFGPDGSFVFQNSGRWRLERGEQWKICAQTEAFLSLFIARDTA